MLNSGEFMNIIETELSPDMEPLTCERRLLECQCAGTTLEKLILKRFSSLATYLKIGVIDIFWPSDSILAKLATAKKDILVKSDEGRVLAWASVSGEIPDSALEVPVDDESVQILYPWDLLRINEIVVGKLSELVE